MLNGPYLRSKTRWMTLVMLVTLVGTPLLFCGVATGAADDNSPIRSKKITRPIEERVPKYFIRSRLA